MRSTIASVALIAGVANGFVTPRQSTTAAFASTTTKTSSSLNAIDPTPFLQDLSHHADHLHSALSSTFTLADLDGAAAAIPDVPATAAVDAVAQAAPDAAAAAAANNNGWFGILAGPIEGLLSLLHTGLVMAGFQNAWGVSILVMTVVIKLVTYPLTKTQLESTNKMQALQPTIKEIQNTYQSNPEVMNAKIAETYQKNEVNPLAGCLPSLVQIPVFVGLYRSVLNLAKENQLNEPFLFLPNLEGPTYGADPSHASEWITTWVDGAPALGWHDTLAFMAIPIFLVISQYASMALMQQSTPQSQDSQNNLILKVLPLMIGWFSVNVPAALGIYWVANNVITTATTVMIRNSMPKPEAATASAGTTTTTVETSGVFANPKLTQSAPQGFSSNIYEDDDIKPITTPIDAEIVTDADESSDVPEASGTGMEAPSKKQRGKKKKKKRKY
mmetsp:Transcript_41677/g.61661  ORF Transcript_41677/g.61661 Transcript_41677/m.61661 type:complete len:444 (-) Transcript_41677:309-1640(-)|eukprot:CAMPEP_0194026728 /NCGR_PEP_ID=MMETSP0009_2-20130614/1021_1 /TAXON_ID=210454 /ORGANISM="Grammatophora oceanica, Strain CCMP 410" /LENGTH=443 /DNA_ID=CAMNT_0038665571 /DNA_START=102 /DNA_END=1433 /DNA_ORIENTATION=+